MAGAPSHAEDEFEPNPSLATLSADHRYARRSARALGTVDFYACCAMGLDNSGRVLVAGMHGDTPCVVRLDTDGRLDTTFGNAGVAETPSIPLRWQEEPQVGLEVDHAGRIILFVACWHILPSYSLSRVVRLRSDGTLDPEFAAGGVFDLPSESGTEFLGPVRATRGDGAMFVFAAKPSSTTDGSQTSLPIEGLVRITADGTIDAEYGDGGFARVAPWPVYRVGTADLAIDSEGRAVVAAQFSGHGGFHITRLDASGAIDTDFRSSAGALWERDRTFRATQVALDGAGRIVTLDEIGLRRRLPDGSPDPAFSDDGYANRYEAAGFQGGVWIYWLFAREPYYRPDDPFRVGGRLAVATGVDRWVIATPHTRRSSRRPSASPIELSARGRRRFPGIQIQVIDPNDPGAITTTKCRAPSRRGQTGTVAGVAITPDGTAAYALGDGYVGRVDLTAPARTRKLQDLRVRWLSVPRAIDLGDGRYRIKARVRIRNTSRRVTKWSRSLVTLEYPAGAYSLEMPGQWASGPWRPVRLRRGESVVRRIRWETEELPADIAGARLSIEIAGREPDANFADNVATSEPITQVLRPK